MRFLFETWPLIPKTLLSFIGISLSIWEGTFGTGGDEPGATAIQDRFNAFVEDRSNNEIFSRV